ncbi:MAG: hypothetical protein ACKVI4_12750, partial [Actinomycetales bacterium]
MDRRRGGSERTRQRSRHAGLAHHRRNRRGRLRVHGHQDLHLALPGKHTEGDGSETLVHGFVSRDEPGWRSLGDWDTLGMRATQSHTTVLDGAFVPANRVARVLPVGPNADPFIFAVFANFLPLIASVYAGIADRALELG